MSTANETYSAMIRNIGAGNVMSICGGKMHAEVDGSNVSVVMICGQGYRVRVRYNAGRDTYSVSREYQRGLNYWIKGERHDVYNTEVGEVAYRAGMFRDEWTTDGARKVV